MGVTGAAGGLLAFGTYLAWSFGRELTDRDAAVVSLTTAICVVTYLIAGLALRHPASDALGPALKLAAVLALTGLLAVPCGRFRT